MKNIAYTVLAATMLISGSCFAECSQKGSFADASRIVQTQLGETLGAKNSTVENPNDPGMQLRLEFGEDTERHLTVSVISQSMGVPLASQVTDVCSEGSNAISTTAQGYHLVIRKSGHALAVQATGRDHVTKTYYFGRLHQD